MKIKLFKLPPVIAKPIHFLLIPWKKYSEFFDNGCWGIWGLSPLLKYTLLYFTAFFIPPIFGLVKLSEDTSTTFTYTGIFIIGALFIAFVWFVYLPIFVVILFKRAIEKTFDIGSKTVEYFSRDPQLVPEEVKTQPSNPALFIRALQYWWFIKSTNAIYKNRKLLIKITSVYPFSLLSRNKMYHAQNQKLWKLIHKIDKLATKAKVPIMINDIGTNPNFFFYAHFEKTKGYPIKKLERVLQKHFGTIYVRKLNKGLIQINTTIGEEE